MFVFEAEVFQLGLYGEQSQAVCQWGVYVEGFPGDFVLLVGGHRAECAHVVQAVGHLYQHHPDVFRHCKEQFAEIFGLCGSLVAEYTP